ncbi:MAG: hypothetical protein Q8M08_12795 [Bacteroidales bacterium]|nr:hypothetical protein [Bacteroidales bacterium]
MKNQKITANIIRWIARIWGTSILAFILFFLFAHIFGTEEGDNGFKNNSISFIFFPVSSIIGLAIALKWEGLGGLITTIGIIGFFILRFDLISDPFYICGPTPPGILYLGYWYLSKGQTKTVEKE